MTDLKPCPFCGGKAEVQNWCDHWWVRCYDCLISRTNRGFHHQSKEEAIADWNRRVE